MDDFLTWFVSKTDAEQNEIWHKVFNPSIIFNLGIIFIFANFYSLMLVDFDGTKATITTSSHLLMSFVSFISGVIVITATEIFEVFYYTYKYYKKEIENV